MKAMFKKIGAMLARLPKLVWKTVVVVGQAVMSLVAVAPEPVYEPEIFEDDEVNIVDKIRALSSIIASGRAPTSDETGGISPRVFEWLRGLDRSQLCVVAVSPNQRLASHLNGELEMPGMTSLRRKPAPEKLEQDAPAPSMRNKRTLREVLEASGRYPTVA